MTTAPLKQRARVDALRVLVVENDPLAADAVHLLLGAQGIEVQTVLSPDFADLLEVCSDDDHHLVMIDLHLHPGEPDGVEIAVELKARRPGISIAIWTSSEKATIAHRAWSAGVQAFLTKRELLGAREQIPALLHSLVSGTVIYHVDPRLHAVAHDHLISDREIEVLQLKLDGRTYREMADKLYLSPRTIDSHLAHIRTKLDATSIQDALDRAVELGLVVRRLPVN